MGLVTRYDKLASTVTLTWSLVIVGCLPTGNPIILSSTYLTSSEQGLIMLIPGLSMRLKLPKTSTRPAWYMHSYLWRWAVGTRSSTSSRRFRRGASSTSGRIRRRWGSPEWRRWPVAGVAGTAGGTRGGFRGGRQRSLLRRFRWRAVGRLRWPNRWVFIGGSACGII